MNRLVGKLEKLAAQKWATIGDEPTPGGKKARLQDYLMRKGYEYGEVAEQVKFLSEDISKS